MKKIGILLVGAILLQGCTSIIALPFKAVGAVGDIIAVNDPATQQRVEDSLITGEPSVEVASLHQINFE